MKLIGYDCSPADNRRYAHREGHVDPRFLFRYPLREWGWTREDCIARIQAAGLPVPVKSSCFFCAAMKPQELRTLPPHYLRLIVLIEARAKPRLKKVDGLWRKSVKGLRSGTPHPGAMTDLIRDEGLLPADEIEHIITITPADLLDFQAAAARVALAGRRPLKDWLASFQDGVNRAAA